MLGGGVGIGFGIRSTDDKSVGVMPHLKTYDASCLAYRQGRTRRGSYATYLDINHPDIVMFLEMRKPTGDQNVRCLNLHHGVNISDRFMELIERCMSDPTADDGWNLCDPHSGEIRETVSAKELWQKILELRMETGEPYIHYIDTSNKHLPEFQKKLGLKIHQSNLCLTGDTVIQIKETENDEPQFIALDEFVEKFALGYFTSPYVKSQVDGEIVWASVSNAAQTGTTDDLYEIESPNGKIIRCTPEHKIYTKNRGYVMSKDLVETDELLEL
jgi:ribonucleoside-diphosphate reductase alpha chain